MKMHDVSQQCQDGWRQEPRRLCLLAVDRAARSAGGGSGGSLQRAGVAGDRLPQSLGLAVVFTVTCVCVRARVRVHVCLCTCVCRGAQGPVSSLSGSISSPSVLLGLTLQEAFFPP